MIFLSILKVIGIVLLCIIALALLILLIILIVPIRYVGAVKGKNKHINLVFEAKWFLGIVHYRYAYINGKEKTKVKVLNKRTKTKSKSNTKQKRDNIKLAISLFKIAGYKIIKHVFPKKIKGKIYFGFDDPALTALLYGLTTWITEQSDKNDLIITPNFDESDLIVNFKIYGRLFLGYVVICLLRFFIKSKIDSLRR